MHPPKSAAACVNRVQDRRQRYEVHQLDKILAIKTNNNNTAVMQKPQQPDGGRDADSETTDAVVVDVDDDNQMACFWCRRQHGHPQEACASRHFYAIVNTTFNVRHVINIPIVVANIVTCTAIVDIKTRVNAMSIDLLSTIPSNGRGKLKRWSGAKTITLGALATEPLQIIASTTNTITYASINVTAEFLIVDLKHCSLPDESSGLLLGAQWCADHVTLAALKQQYSDLQLTHPHND